MRFFAVTLKSFNRSVISLSFLLRHELKKKTLLLNHLTAQNERNNLDRQFNSNKKSYFYICYKLFLSTDRRRSLGKPKDDSAKLP